MKLLFTKTVVLMTLFTTLVTTAAVLSVCTGQRAYASSIVAAQDGSASPTVAGKWEIIFYRSNWKPEARYACAPAGWLESHRELHRTTRYFFRKRNSAGQRNHVHDRSDGEEAVLYG